MRGGSIPMTAPSLPPRASNLAKPLPGVSVWGLPVGLRCQEDSLRCVVAMFADPFPNWYCSVFSGRHSVFVATFRRPIPKLVLLGFLRSHSTVSNPFLFIQSTNTPLVIGNSYYY